MIESWLCIQMPARDYQDALNLQHMLVDAKVRGLLTSNLILLLEHPPVFTLGHQGGRQSLRVAESVLKQQGIAVVQTERGGDITYHGLGQLVGYPIVDLATPKWDIKDFVCRLEEVMLRTVAAWGVQSERNPLNRGIWIGMDKLGSIGIAVRKGVSFHGFSLNVNLDLKPYEWIEPCGLKGIGVNSMEQITGQKITVEDVLKVVKQHIQSVFKIELQTESIENIERFCKKLSFVKMQ